jgi:hypothetical protein
MKYYIATNNVDVFHFGILEEGSEITTGQPVLNFYKTETEMVEALTAFTGDPNYYETHREDTEDLLYPEIPPII